MVVIHHGYESAHWALLRQGSVKNSSLQCLMMMMSKVGQENLPKLGSSSSDEIFNISSVEPSHRPLLMLLSMFRRTSPPKSWLRTFPPREPQFWDPQDHWAPLGLWLEPLELWTSRRLPLHSRERSLVPRIKSLDRCLHINHQKRMLHQYRFLLPGDLRVKALCPFGPKGSSEPGTSAQDNCGQPGTIQNYWACQELT